MAKMSCETQCKPKAYDIFEKIHLQVMQYLFDEITVRFHDDNFGTFKKLPVNLNGSNENED